MVFSAQPGHNRTMRAPIFQVDAFTSEVFGGNPAAVCPLERWIPDQLMQRIAAENALSETAFYIRDGAGYHLRWFAPNAEIDLCGHATLATAFVLRTELGVDDDVLRFNTKSGELRVTGTARQLTLDFPALPPVPCECPEGLLQALGLTGATAVLFETDYIVVVEHESQVRSLKPDLAKLMPLKGRGVVVTAPGDRHDFVSRFFGPKVGIDEDPVTGSAHCWLTPYWSERLGKTSLRAAQLSARGGEIDCTIRDGRIFLTGTAVLFLRGEIEVPEEAPA